MVPSYKCTQPEFQVLECSSDCDRDCEFSAWTIWSQCDKTCGVSVATRYRRIIKQPIGIGKQCPNEIEQTMPCDYIPCVKWKAANWFPCVPYYGSCGWGVQFGIPQFKPKNFKGSLDPNHFIFEIIVGKSRIRHTTKLY